MSILLQLTIQLTILHRPWVYGLAIGGKLGARDALRGLLAVSSCYYILPALCILILPPSQDLDRSMGLAGIRTIADCNRSMIRRVQYGGDVKSSN